MLSHKNTTISSSRDYGMLAIYKRGFPMRRTQNPLVIFLRILH